MCMKKVNKITDLSVVKDNMEWLDEVWKKIEEKLAKTSVKSRNKIPYTTVGGVHDDKSDGHIDWWTNGFWGGMMWLMYSETGNEEYKITAERSEELLDKAFSDFRKLHHDVGFMWHILAGANYRLTGNKQAYNKNLYAASLLASRYNIDARFIRAWNGPGAIGWSIIDCLMNIPLLYWAAGEVQDDRFKKIAMAHADMTIRDHIRSDGSVNHIVEHDVDTGEFVTAHAGQGYSKDSCWSRGLAWAIYGTTLSYIHTAKREYLCAAKRTANYFITNSIRYGYKTPVDFMAPLTPVYYDSTAGVCAACGLLELSKYVSEAEGAAYTNAAINILKATDTNFCNYSDDNDSIVQMGTERYPHNNMEGVHIPIIYGDFFFVEAMLKLKGNDFLIW